MKQLVIIFLNLHIKISLTYQTQDHHKNPVNSKFKTIFKDIKNFSL